MERLTIKSPSGLIHLYDNLKNTVNQAIKKLSDYEDAEEQRLLIRLPVKIGDTIYKIPSKKIYEINIIDRHPEFNRIYCQEVTSIKIYKSGVFIETCDGMSGVRLETFGTYWFLKKEEAEHKLKEMEAKNVIITD